jgi:hypothetical protein
VQGKESYVVPDAMVNQVVAEFVKARLPKGSITQTQIRAVLKALRLRRAYDHVSQIYTRITGLKAPRITAEQEDACRNMFVRMQPVFEEICPKDRKNFLSYNYVLFRCFHILGLYHMLPTFSLLKGHDKLMIQARTLRFDRS